MDASETDELSPDSQFGGYVVRHCIGRGGMARVYRAEHSTLRKPVALKVMDSAWLAHAAGTRRFLGEARAAAAVKHRNVVDIVDLGVWAERPYIVMELLDGLDLEHYLAKAGPLPESEVVALALPVIAGVAAVHSAGIVHRDLKPSNIFLAVSNEGEITPKVLDFGISKLSEQLREPGHGRTGSREIIGTPTYMSPEALNGVRDLGPAADQYSLGVVLYQCAVGKPPFLGDTLLSLLRSIALGVFAPPRAVRPQLSATLDAVISRAMRVNPEDRFDHLRDLGRALWPLADERTRVIWAPHFGDADPEPTKKRLPAHGALERNDGMPVAVARDRTRESSRRSRLALGVCLALGAALSLGYGVRWLLVKEDAPVARGIVSEQASSSAPRPMPLSVEASTTSPAPPVGVSAFPPAANVNGASEESARTDALRDKVERSRAPRRRHRQPERPLRAATAVPASPGAAPPVDSRSDRSLDPDLAALFELTPHRERPAPPPSAVSEADDELRGLFPNAEGVRPEGKNAAPILD